MSTNLSTDSGPASNPNPAPVTSSDSLPSAPANAAVEAHEPSNETAASGKDASIDDLDKQYRENLLAADKPAVDPAQPEKTQPETVEAKADEEPVEVTEPEQIDLEEQTGPRTVDDFRKLFPRAEPKAREELAKIEAEKFALQGELDSVGGTVGMEIGKQLLPILLTPPTRDGNESDTAFQVLTETNPALMQGMSWQILTHALNEKSLDPANGKPINLVTGDALIKQFLNEKYDVEKLEKLIAYDEAGLLDHDELATELESFSGKSDREKALEARLQALESGKQQEQAAQESKTAERINQHVAKTEDYVSKGAMTRIVAIAEEYGWTATKEELESSDPAVKEAAEFKVALGELLTPWLDNYVRSHVKWAGIESIGKEERAFNADWNPTILLKKNGEDLINAAVAAFKGKVRTMNKAFQKMAGSSRKVQLKEKTTRSGAVEPSEIPPVKKPEPNGKPQTLDEEIAALGRTYQQSLRG